MRVKSQALLSTVICCLALPSHAQQLPPRIAPSPFDSAKAISGSANPERITRTERIQWLLSAFPHEGAPALPLPDAAYLSREAKSEAKFEEQLASESRAQIDEICKQVDVLDAVSLAVAMKQVNAYADRRREERYLQIDQSISVQGKAAFEEQLRNTAATLIKYDPDIVGIATAMPDAYKSNVRAMCQATPKPSPMPVIPPGTQSPQIAG